MEYLGLYEFLDPEDFLKQEWNGKKLISLAERIHIAYSKALLREGADERAIKAYLDQAVTPLLEPYPDMQYVSYFKAKLLLAMGSREAGIKAFLPFARRKQKEFWVWQVFAEANEHNPELYLACLCKALNCPTKTEFLSGIKERIVLFLIKTADYNWAKTELDNLVQLRDKMKWGLRSHHRQWLQSPWYQHATTIDPKDQYHRLIPYAEALLGISQREEVMAVVSGIQESKKLFNFLTTCRKEGFAKYKSNLDLYGCYQLIGRWDKKFFKIDSLKPSLDLERNAKLCKIISGKIRIRESQNFGFLEGAFVPPSLVTEYQLKNNDRIAGKAIYCPAKGKNKWGWKMVEISG